MAKHLESRFARIISSSERVWSNGNDREILQHEATVFELFDQNGQSIRTVASMDDGGRWVFVEHGIRHPIESSFPYEARRKRDRFNREHLQQLIVAYGLPLVTVDTFLNASQYHLFDIPNVTADTCTIAEADDPAYGYYRRGLTWVPSMTTHASSVIADFERCLRLNPAYEPRVREVLEIAYRVIGPK